MLIVCTQCRRLILYGAEYRVIEQDPPIVLCPRCVERRGEGNVGRAYANGKRSRMTTDEVNEMFDRLILGSAYVAFRDARRTEPGQE